MENFGDVFIEMRISPVADCVIITGLHEATYSKCNSIYMMTPLGASNVHEYTPGHYDCALHCCSSYGNRATLNQDMPHCELTIVRPRLQFTGTHACRRLSNWLMWGDQPLTAQWPLQCRSGRVSLIYQYNINVSLLINNMDCMRSITHNIISKW